MLDIKFIRENAEFIEQSAKNKGILVDVAHILAIDTKRLELQHQLQKLQEEKNTAAKEVQGKPTPEQIEKGKKIKEALEIKQHALQAVDAELQEWLMKIPNPAKPDVKVGKNDTENDVIRKFKEPTVFAFAPKDHLELGELLDIIDVKRAGKVSGARFSYLKNEAVLLEFALVQFALDTLLKEGFIPIVPPVLVKPEAMRGLGYMENGGEEDMFHIANDNFILVGTAEHSVVTMHMDETFQKRDLPKRYVGFSTAFRREAGSYGKDTRGILRVHQFDKVEMVSFVPEGEDDKEHDYLLSLEEAFFQKLGIPYQVAKMCTGDLGFPAARKYDIEAWMPGQQKYREVTSVSTIVDFQSRRLRIKYHEGDSKKYPSILNGTAFAIGRTIIAIIENYQQQDGSVAIPDVLQKYVGKKVISPKK